MKIANTIFVIVAALSSSVQAANLKTSEVPGNDEMARKLEGTGPVAILSSDECKGFTEKFTNGMAKILSYSDKAVTAFVCNPIERKRIAKHEEQMEVDVALSGRRLMFGDTVPDKCLLAYEKMLLEHRETILKSTRSTANCKAQVQTELKEVNAHARKLAENDRELGLFWVGFGISILGSAWGWW